VGNSYGHPGAEVMDALLTRGAMVARTDQLGTVTVATDGSDLFVRAGGRAWAVANRRSTLLPLRASY
jgi:beta-lactamase superfamily II metal-dependent hydrolase